MTTPDKNALPDDIRETARVIADVHYSPVFGANRVLRIDIERALLAERQRATDARLIEGLRKAVSRLYSCRYSEVPLAKELDALLKEVTGETIYETGFRKFFESSSSRPSPSDDRREPAPPPQAPATRLREVAQGRGKGRTLQVPVSNPALATNSEDAWERSFPND